MSALLYNRKLSIVPARRSRLISFLRLAARQLWVSVLRFTGCFWWVKRQLRMRGDLVTLTFHRVLTDEQMGLTNSLSGISIREKTFGKLVQYLEAEFDVCDLRTAAPGAAGRRAKAILTFDDGWHDNLTVAFPIIQRRKLPATIFVCPAALGQTLPFWPERAISALRGCYSNSRADDFLTTIEELKRSTTEERKSFLDSLSSQGDSIPGNRALDSTLTQQDVTAMSAVGVNFGSHTYTHQILTHIPAELARNELRQSKAALETLLAMPCLSFAYPNGNCDHRVRTILAEEGYTRAFTTARGVWTTDTDLLAIPRSYVGESSVVGLTGRFSPMMFEFTALWRPWRATRKRKPSPSAISLNESRVQS